MSNKTITDNKGNVYAFDRELLDMQVKNLNSMSPEDVAKLQIEWFDKYWRVNGKKHNWTEMDKKYLAELIKAEREGKHLMVMKSRTHKDMPQWVFNQINFWNTGEHNKVNDWYQCSLCGCMFKTPEEVDQCLH